MSGPLPFVAKAVRLDMHFAVASDPNVQMREFFQYTGTLSVSDAQTWLGVMQTSLAVFVNALLQNTWSLQFMELTDLSSATSPQVTNSTAVTGGGTEPSVPAGTALVLRKHILRRYRGGHPRVYIPGLGNGGLSAPGTWATSFANTVSSDYSTFIAGCIGGTPVAAGSGTHINISYYQGFTNHLYPSGRVKAIPSARATPLVDTIVSISPNYVVASQRRRNEQP